MTRRRPPPTPAELSDIEKGVIRLKGGDPKKQEDIDKFFNLSPSSRRKLKRAYVDGLEGG